MAGWMHLATKSKCIFHNHAMQVHDIEFECSSEYIDNVHVQSVAHYSDVIYRNGCEKTKCDVHSF